MVTIDLKALYGDGPAKIESIPEYEWKAKAAVGFGDDVTITGPAPIWLYLIVAHALHGFARSLTYQSPVTGPVLIWDHNPR